MIALPLDTAFVARSYIDEDGKSVCDLSRLGLGAVDWVGVQVCVLGGGAGRFLVLPPAPSGVRIMDGAEVVVGFFANRRPVILGVLGHAQAGLSAQAVPAQGANQNLTPKIDKDTAGLAWDGATIATRGGAIALTAAEDEDVSAQVSGDGVFRVAQNGEASDWAVLAKALVAELAPLYTKINAQDAQIAVLTTAVAALSSPLPPPAGVGTYLPSALEPLQTTDVAAKVLRVSGEIGG